ncbi:MAG: hypothetical protein PVH61_29660 [Candidatus Aminicenantes bacterium]
MENKITDPVFSTKERLKVVSIEGRSKTGKPREFIYPWKIKKLKIYLIFPTIYDRLLLHNGTMNHG